ncbi:MAG: EI24 domain-containing protein [Sphingomonas sp.]
MIHAFFLSLGQLTDRPVVSVLLKSLAVTLLLFAAAGVGLWFGLDRLFDAYVASWRDESGIFAAVATAMLLAGAWWLLFRAIAVAVIGVFGDEVVAAVEMRHYPAAHAAARPVPLARSLAMGLGSAARAIGVNLLLLPVYLLLIVTGVGTPILFFAVNGWLLGRDLGDMVAARHLPAGQLSGWRRQTALRRFALGLIGTGLFVIPVLNLVAPVLGAAMATHMFHRARRA